MDQNENRRTKRKVFGPKGKERWEEHLKLHGVCIMFRLNSIVPVTFLATSHICIHNIFEHTSSMKPTSKSSDSANQSSPRREVVLDEGFDHTVSTENDRMDGENGGASFTNLHDLQQMSSLNFFSSPTTSNCSLYACLSSCELDSHYRLTADWKWKRNSLDGYQVPEQTRLLDVIEKVLDIIGDDSDDLFQSPTPIRWTKPRQ